MSRTLQIGMICLGTLGLVLSIGVWTAATVISFRNPGLGFTMGYGRDRGLLLNLRADADGSLCIQHFPKNLSTRSGLYFDATRATNWMKVPLRMWLLPRTGSDPTCRRMYWHVAPSAIVSIVLLVGALVPGWMRRRHRRRYGLCERCGYDLRGATTGLCSECGHPANGRSQKAPNSAVSG